MNALAGFEEVLEEIDVVCSLLDAEQPDQRDGLGSDADQSELAVLLYVEHEDAGRRDGREQRE